MPNSFDQCGAGYITVCYAQAAGEVWTCVMVCDWLVPLCDCLININWKIPTCLMHS